jgi:MFS family permease
MVLYFTQRWILGPVIPSLMVEFGVDKTALGVVGSASLWGYMLTPVLAGLLSDRLGRKYITLAGIFGFSVLTFFSGTAVTTGQLFALRFITGIAEACFFIPLMAYILEVFPERPGFYLTLMSSGSSLGWFTGPALSGWLLSLSGSWRLPFFVTGLTGLFVAGLLLSFWPSKESHGRAGPFLDRSLLRSKSLILLAFLSLVAAFNISAEFGFTMWLPAFLELEVFLSPAAAGLIAGLYGVGQCLGRPVLGWISDRLAYRPVGITGATALGISLILVLGQESTLLRGVFTFQAGFIGAAVMGTLWTFTGLFFSSSKGLALGVITTVGYVAAATSPILIGYVGDHHSVATGLRSVCVPSAFMAGLCFLATFMVQPLRRREGYGGVRRGDGRIG